MALGRKPSIKVSILADVNELMRAYDAAERRSQTFGQKMTAIGSTLTKSVTLPLIGLGAAAVKAAAEQEKASAKLSSTFQSMGASAWTSVEALEAQAAQFQANSTFGDELIMTGQSILLTFGNLRNEIGEGNQIFDRTTQVMLDLSAALDQDLKSSAVQLGKALNDPIQGVSALQRVGVSFTEQQKEQIRVLQQAGDLLGAQKLILAELERQFGGTAKAISETASGRMAKAMNDLGDALEVIGAEVIPVLADVAEEVGDLAKAFGDLPDPAQSAIVKIAMLGFVAGPVATVVGKLATAFNFLKSAWLGLGTLGALGGMTIWQLLGGVVQSMVNNIGLLPAVKEIYPQSWTSDLQEITGLFGDTSSEAAEFQRQMGMKPEGWAPPLKEVVTILSDGSNELAEFNRHLAIQTQASASAALSMDDFKTALGKAGDALDANYNHFFSFDGILWSIADGAQQAITNIREAHRIATERELFEETAAAWGQFGTYGLPSDLVPRYTPEETPAQRSAREKREERNRREQFVEGRGGL